RFLQTRHFTQCKRVANRSQINHIAETCPCHLRTDRPTTHCQTCLGEFNAFAIRQHSETTLDVQLRDHRAKPCLDLVRFGPALIEFLELLQIRFFFSKKALRKDPSLVSWDRFCAAQSHRASFIVFATPFACACSADTCTNDEIITPNHI